MTKWTTEWPAAPGIYWVRGGSDPQSGLIRVDHQGHVFPLWLSADEPTSFDYLERVLEVEEYQGPITPDE